VSVTENHCPSPEISGHNLAQEKKSCEYDDFKMLKKP
jgi:hypothetical protein